jgi:hypothetical protein
VALLTPQIPAHKAISDIPAIVEESAVKTVPDVEGMFYVEDFEAVNAVIGLLRIVAIDQIVGIAATDGPVRVGKILAIGEGPGKIAILGFPDIVAIIAIRVIRAELMRPRRLALQFIKLVEKRPVCIDNHLRPRPFVGYPVLVLINRKTGLGRKDGY